MSFFAKILQNSSKTLMSTVSTVTSSLCPKILHKNQNLSLTTFINRQIPVFSVYRSVPNVLMQQTRAYKQKIRLRKRCKNCYFVWRNGRLYVECTEHPRHKQHHVVSMLRGFDNIPNGYVKGDVKC